MVNLIGFGEHAGSEVPDVFKAWQDAGLAAPVIEEMFGGKTPDRTILTMPLAFGSGTSLGTNLGTGDEANKKRIIEFCQKPRSKAEIQKHLGISSERYVRQKLLTPLLMKGVLSRTIPDKPSSSKQKYIAT